MIPDGTDFVVAFVVDDIREAIDRVQAAGLEMVSEPVWASEAFGDPELGEFAWFWVRAPDGRIYAIQQIPADTNAPSARSQGLSSTRAVVPLVSRQVDWGIKLPVREFSRVERVGLGVVYQHRGERYGQKNGTPDRRHRLER